MEVRWRWRGGGGGGGVGGEKMKPHPQKLAFIAIKMSQETPREKRLDLRNLTLQYWHILLLRPCKVAGSI